MALSAITTAHSTSVGPKPMQTYVAKPGEIEKKWVLIDADGLVVGRLATLIAMRLKGKHKASYTPHVDTGDNVIVINAEKVVFTGNKTNDKVYYRHTGYPGGIRTQSLERMMERNAEQVVRQAVKRMLPKSPLGRQMLRKLKIYNGPTHPHQAQQPETYPLPDRARARTNA